MKGNEAKAENAAAEAADTEGKNTENQSVEDAGEQEDDLENALKEFDRETTTPEETGEKAKEADADEAARLKRIEKQLEDNRRRETNEDIRKAAGTIRDADERLSHLSTDWVEALMLRDAEKDERIQQAFVNRYARPAEYERVLKGLAAKYAKDMKNLPDESTTRDREAINSSVRGSQTASPSDSGFDEDVARTGSDAEFQKMKKRLLAGGA